MFLCCVMFIRLLSFVSQGFFSQGFASARKKIVDEYQITNNGTFRIKFSYLIEERLLPLSHL